MPKKTTSISMKKAKAGGSITPVRPLQQNLPLLDENLSWERFEEFCRDFVSRSPGVRRVSSYGRRGSKQKGIDFPAAMESGKTWSFQCKQVKDFTASQFRKVVEKDEYEADFHVLLLACQAGVPLRDGERKAAGWEVWDVTDISRMIRQLSPHDQRALVGTHFGSHVQETFLGVKGPAAFRDWQEHFAPYLRHGRLFHHRTPLVGRDEILESLDRFSVSPDICIAVLPGRGGVGKTKVLHAFGQRQLDQGHDRQLLYADEGTPITVDTLQDIPAMATTIVVDDAHRRDDLGELLSFVARWPHPLKVVLAIRPEGRDRISSLLAESAIDAGDVLWLSDLGELPRAQGRELAAQALGKDFEHLADRLFAATWDCPLVTIVGAELLQSKQLPPELLEQDRDFRHAVLDKFADAALGRLGDGIDQTLAARLLELVSALQPIRPNEGTFVESAGDFLGVQKEDFVRTLDALERAGVLLRRGYQLRIVPDVLADHLLGQACLTSTGESTGYVDHLLEAFAGVAFDRLIANTAELDWRVQAASGSGTKLLDRMWGLYEAEFKTASNGHQVALLRLIKDAAVYQPGRVLELVEWSIDHPSTVADDTEAGSFFRQTRDDVLHLLAELADRCAHGGHVRRAADILWLLGRDDLRPMNQFPNHAIRLLTELAGYDLGKPLYISEEVLEAALGWLRQPDAHDHVRSPLDVLDALLTKNILNHSTDGLRVNLRPVSINPDSTRALRGRVLQLVERLVLQGELKAAVRSVQTLEAVLREPIPYLGQVVTSDEKSAWEDEQMRALGALAKGMARSDAPLVQLEVADAVAWTAGHSYSSGLRDGARVIWDQLPDTFEVRMMQAITRPWGRELDLAVDLDFDEAERRRTDRMMKAADELAVARSTASELLAFLEQAVADCRSADVKVDAAYLTGLLAERHPVLAAEAAAEIAAVPGHPVEFLLAQFLLGARYGDAEQALKIAMSAVQGGSKIAAIGVGYLYAYQVWRDANLPGDMDVLLALLRSHDDDVRAMGIAGLKAIPNLDPDEGKKLILGTRVASSARIGEALAQVLEPGTSSIYAPMTDGELTQLVGQFESLDHLDEYHIRRLARGLANRVPTVMLYMLIRRIDSLEARGGSTSFQPVPHNWAGEAIWEGISTDVREELMRAVRDAVAVESWPRRAALPDLYADLADDDWSVAARVLDEWIQMSDPARLISAVSLFSRAPSDFVFEHPEVVERTLNAAAKMGHDSLRAARRGFAASARSSTKMGRVLQPMPQDLEMRDRARKMVIRYPEGSPTRTFFDNLISDAESMIAHMRKVDEELIGGPLP
jgi:hypothetical protein